MLFLISHEHYRTVNIFKDTNLRLGYTKAFHSVYKMWLKCGASALLKWFRFQSAPNLHFNIYVNLHPELICRTHDAQNNLVNRLVIQSLHNLCLLFFFFYIYAHENVFNVYYYEMI